MCVNGVAGTVAFDGELPFAVLAFTIVGDRAIAIDVSTTPSWSRSSTSAESHPTGTLASADAAVCYRASRVPDGLLSAHL